MPSVKGGDLNKFLHLTVFVILLYFIEIHKRAIFWRTVPLNVAVLFDALYRSMLQYYLTDCTAQCCNIIYYLYMKEEQLWQNERNSALCEPQLAAERLNSVHRLSRETHLISPRDLFTDLSLESLLKELATWRSCDLPTQYTRSISWPFSNFVSISYGKQRCSVVYRHTAICFNVVFCARCYTVSATSRITSQKIRMWFTDLQQGKSICSVL